MRDSGSPAIDEPAIARLIGLTHRLPPTERERLALGVMSLRAELFVQNRPVPAALDAILQALVLDQPREARARLAARLAGPRWAPPELVRALASDEAAVATAVLLRSPHLRDHDLIRVFAEGTLQHQAAIARRPSLSPALVETILQTGDAVLLTALATNDRAAFSSDAMRRLVGASRRHVALRTPLARHPRLTAELAQRLAGWGGAPLRHLLASRFTLRPEEPAAAEDEPEDLFVEKLDQAGRLRLGYLVETLRQGQLSMFVAALAKLGGFDPGEIRTAIDSDRPELLALACAAIGLDQQVFPAILDGVRALNGGRPAGGEEAARRASGAFAPFDPAVAARAFRQSLAAV